MFQSARPAQVMLARDGVSIRTPRAGRDCRKGKALVFNYLNTAKREPAKRTTKLLQFVIFDVVKDLTAMSLAQMRTDARDCEN